MNAPIITLKNVKHAEFASHETNCFSATVYVDGKRFCYVENDGHGGPDHYSPISGAQNAFYADGGPYKALDARIKATIPAREFHGRMLYANLEQLVGEALEEHLVTKEVRAKMRSKILTHEQGKIFAYGYKGVRKIAPRHLEQFCAEKPDVEVLNMMPIEQAVALYKKAAS